MVNNGPLKVCSHRLKLVFNGGTAISNIVIPKIPQHQFKYKAIGDFLNGHFQNDILYGDGSFVHTYLESPIVRIINLRI